MPIINVKDLKALAEAEGLTVWGHTGAEPLEKARSSLQIWQERGSAGGMAYMTRPSDLLSSPQALLLGAVSVISFAIRYSASPHASIPIDHGKVARYAWGLDYHDVLRDRLQSLAVRLKAICGEQFKFRVFSDSVPLMERALAERAKLGFVGKNTMLIRPGEGSYFFLAEMLTNLEIRDVDSLPIDRGRCGKCTLCLTSCPTGALQIGEPYMLDARKCISYLTIEKRGAFEDWEKKAIGEWVFGCDLCQECCPFNHTVMKEESLGQLEFSPEKGVGSALSLFEVLSIRSQKQYKARFNRTPLLRPKREGLLRNCAVVAGNRHAYNLFNILMEAAERDESSVVRESALWALCELRSGLSGTEARSAARLLERTGKDRDAWLAGRALDLLRRTYENDL